MKNKPKELDVDFIGGDKPLTKEEENLISDYIKKHKKTLLTTKVKRAKKIAL